MPFLGRNPIAFIDVDDTLIRSAGSKRIPITSVVERVRELHQARFVLYLWSAGGADYARRTAEELGIADCFAEFLPKPDLLIDDQHPSDWRQMRWLHTNSVAAFDPLEYLEGKGEAG